ncbi:MAG: pyroglutamyl-peptidase I [Blastocatellia bacterium]|nr:pyroglutamyl-peptidase I [Blastocatellia bacterium]
MKILLTAFEPFGGDTINPTQQIVERIALSPPPGTEVVFCHLPVTADAAVEQTLAALAREKPDGLISLGLSALCGQITLERIAINLDDYRIPDNTGHLRQDEPIVPGGPPAYWTRLPLRRMFHRLQAENIPVQYSNSAGTFICNHLFYVLLHVLESQKQALPFGFIHIPCSPEMVQTQSERPFLPLTVMTCGIALCVDQLARHIRLESGEWEQVR